MSEKKQKNHRKKVLFSFHAPQAEKVILAGDFNEWSPDKHGMKRGRSGAWEASLLLTASTYEYKYLVDGRWEMDPANNQTCKNCFGTYNNLLTVSE